MDQLDPIIIRAILDRIGEEKSETHNSDTCQSCRIHRQIAGCDPLTTTIALGRILILPDEMFVLGFLIASEYYAIKHLEGTVVTTGEKS